MPAYAPEDWPKITDLSAIRAENFKFRNTEFLRDSDDYELTGRETFEELRQQIWVTRNSDLRRILYDFPTDAPLNEQCAGWMHAVAGKHFFPDANHRTALATLRKLLRENSIPLGEWPASISKQVVLHSHRVRSEIDNVHLNTLYRHDRLFLVWLLYFNVVLDPPTE